DLAAHPYEILHCKGCQDCQKFSHVGDMDHRHILYTDYLPRFWAAALLSREEIIAANPAGNMAAPLLAERLGGDLLMSFVAAVAFATILAVVAGLVLSGASAFAHDIYGQVIKKGKISEQQQMLAAKIAAFSVSVFSIILAIFAQNQNVAFLVSLAFCVAASANLPVIVFTIFWKRFNTAGAITGILTGLFAVLILVVL